MGLASKTLETNLVLIKEIWNDWQNGELSDTEALQYMSDNIQDKTFLKKINTCLNEGEALLLIENEYSLSVFG